MIWPVKRAKDAFHRVKTQRTVDRDYFCLVKRIKTKNVHLIQAYLYNCCVMEANLNDEEVIRHYPDTNSNDCFEDLYNRYVTEVYSRYLFTTNDTGKAPDLLTTF